MRWIPFFILVYVLLGLQMGFAGLPVNFPIVAVLLGCLSAPREVALTAALVVGLCHDLVSGSPPGLHAVAYGLAAMLCASRRSMPNHVLLHAAMGLVSGLVVAGVLAMHSIVKPVVPGASVPFGQLLLTAMTGMVVAPMFLSVLKRLDWAFVRTSDKFHMRR